MSVLQLSIRISLEMELWINHHAKGNHTSIKLITYT